MRVYEEKKVVKKEKFLVRTSCVFCETIANDGYLDSSSGEIDKAEVEVNITQKKNMRSQEDGHGTRINLDLCSECFKNKLIPWLVGEGADIEEDWASGTRQQ